MIHTNLKQNMNKKQVVIALVIFIAGFILGVANPRVVTKEVTKEVVTNNCSSFEELRVADDSLIKYLNTGINLASEGFRSISGESEYTTEEILKMLELNANAVDVSERVRQEIINKIDKK